MRRHAVLVLAVGLAGGALVGCGGMRGAETPETVVGTPDRSGFGLDRGRVVRVAGGMAVPWGSLPTTDEPVDVDASAPLVVWVAVRRAAAVALDRETGVVRERLDLDAVRALPTADALAGDAEVRAVRALLDGSIAALVAGAEPRLVVWDPGRRATVLPLELPAGAFDLERDTDDALVVLGENGALVWTDVRGRRLRTTAVPGAATLDREDRRLVVRDAAGRALLLPPGR